MMFVSLPSSLTCVPLTVSSSAPPRVSLPNPVDTGVLSRHEDHPKSIRPPVEDMERSLKELGVSTGCRAVICVREGAGRSAC